ncbi:MAG: hypothetical protein QOF77_2237 [Solirubrobacteraceae bacterium]|jgi:hypothetical protein|nr:hypothetical protein [Solirubrobacteraceae bacterium]
MIIAIKFNDVILAVHIMAVVAAFGVLLAYPLLVGLGRRIDPRGLPFLHRTQQQVIGRLVTSGLVVVIIAGIYLASELKAFSAFYVQWGFVAAIALGGIASGYLGPREGRLAELAERDLAGGGTLSAEYDALSHQVRAVSALASVLVLATVFVMTTHLGM